MEIEKKPKKYIELCYEYDELTNIFSVSQTFFIKENAAKRVVNLDKLKRLNRKKYREIENHIYNVRSFAFEVTMMADLLNVISKDSENYEYFNNEYKNSLEKRNEYFNKYNILINSN